MTLSPSVYFTYGDITTDTKSYSIATYLTLNHKENYIFASGRYCLEDGKTGNLQQQTFLVGYAKAILPKLGIRTVGFYIGNSYNNISGILSARLLYGYNPIFSIGGAGSLYSKYFYNQRKFYNTFQINPEVRYFAVNKIWLSLGINYTNATQENYFALLSGFNVYLSKKLNLQVNSSYGETFYHIDDRLLIINNRPNLQKGSIAFNTKYNITNNLKIALVLQKDFFRTYDVNYCAIGIENN